MKVPFTLGVVGHVGLAVCDPKKSAKWFERALGLTKQFDFENGVAIGNDNGTIALFKGRASRGMLDHMSFHLPNIRALRRALAHLKKIGADIEDPGGGREIMRRYAFQLRRARCHLTRRRTRTRTAV
jgi:catechol-2,3-dioxygenase